MLRNLLRLLKNEYGQVWDQVLTQEEFSYNDSINRSNAMSPFEVVYDIYPRGVFEIMELRNHEGNNGHAEEFS